MTPQEYQKRTVENLMATTSCIDYGAQLHNLSNKHCRPFLAGLCPHEALISTRGSIGECKKIHDVGLRAYLETHEHSVNKRFLLGLRITAYSYLTGKVEEVQRTSRQKIKKIYGEIKNCDKRYVKDRRAKARALEAQLDAELAIAEKYGEQGRVRESLQHVENAESIRTRRNQLECSISRRLQKPKRARTKLQLVVCDGCGFCVGVDDHKNRIATHKAGRLHQCMMAIEEQLNSLRAMIENVEPWAVLKHFSGRPRDPRYVSTLRSAFERAERNDRRRSSYPSSSSSQDHSYYSSSSSSVRTRSRSASSDSRSSSKENHSPSRSRRCRRSRSSSRNRSSDRSSSSSRRSRLSYRSSQHSESRARSRSETCTHSSSSHNHSTPVQTTPRLVLTPSGNTPAQKPASKTIENELPLSINRWVATTYMTSPRKTFLGSMKPIVLKRRNNTNEQQCFANCQNFNLAMIPLPADGLTSQIQI